MRRGEQEIATYRYDAQGRRIGKSVAADPAAARTFIYNGKQLIAEADANGTILKQFIYIGWRPVAWVAPAHTLGGKIRQFFFGPELVYLHTDHRGAVTAASDEQQALLWRGDVDSHGKVRHDENRGNAIEQPLRLVNQYADDETGLHYNLARYYDPHTGNFMSPDPAGFDAGYLDLYAYANGDMLNFVDPNGWASIRYYAIDDGVKTRPNLQPNQGHWAFAIRGIAGHEDKMFVYDKGGSYLGAGQVSKLYEGAAASGAAVDGFTNYYAEQSSFYSPTQFQMDMSDADAAAIIKQFTGQDLGTHFLRCQ